MEDREGFEFWDRLPLILKIASLPFLLILIVVLVAFLPVAYLYAWLTQQLR